jgi:hypothetical protein
MANGWFQGFAGGAKSMALRQTAVARTPHPYFVRKMLVEPAKLRSVI